MTKYLCTRCSALIDRSCKLETNEYNEMPDKCPFSCEQVEWKIVSEFPEATRFVIVE